MGKFVKGMKRPPNSGRRAGTPNKKTLVLGENLKELSWDVLKRLKFVSEQLDPVDEADVLLRVLALLYPRPTYDVNATNIQVNTVNNVNTEETEKLVQEFKDIVVDYANERKDEPKP